MRLLCSKPFAAEGACLTLVTLLAIVLQTISTTKPIYNVQHCSDNPLDEFETQFERSNGTRVIMIDQRVLNCDRQLETIPELLTSPVERSP